jgi:nicotinamidase-related amidase
MATAFGHVVWREVAVVSVRKPDIVVDVCTQRDYLVPTGARPCANATEIVPNIKRLIALARWSGLPTLSCVDARRPCDVRGLPQPDCVLGTPGQHKLPFTLLPDRVQVNSDNCLCVSLDLLQQHQQAILAKCHRDPFTNPKLDRLLTEICGRRFLIFGVGLETSIRLLTLGLMLRHRKVAVIHDACGWWDPEEGGMALRQLAAKGCLLISTRELVASVMEQRKRNGRSRLAGRRSVA